MLRTALILMTLFLAWCVPRFALSIAEKEKKEAIA